MEWNDPREVLPNHAAPVWLKTCERNEGELKHKRKGIFNDRDSIFREDMFFNVNSCGFYKRNDFETYVRRGKAIITERLNHWAYFTPPKDINK